MSGRKVGQKVFDWTKLARQLPQEVKSDFSGFRARHEACRARYVLGSNFMILGGFTNAQFVKICP